MTKTNLATILFSMFFMVALFLFGNPLVALTNQKAFTEIYEKGSWGKNISGEGTSGEGSTLDCTESYRNFLKNFLKDHDIKSVVDLGCGDWEFSKTIDWTGIEYLGVDVVKSVIKHNNKTFGKSNVKFICCDGASFELPKADLLICKDVLQHLPNKDILSIAEQFSKFRYCLLTNDVVNPFSLLDTNADLSKPGDFRPLDLLNFPFNFMGKKVFSFSTPTNGKESIKEVVLLEN